MNAGVPVGCLILALSLAGRRVEGAEAPGVCIDEEIKADLDAKRRQRSVKVRLVQKTNRHELNLRGGELIADLFEATWVVGASYAYHLTEDFAVEASGAYTRFSSAAAPELERRFAVLGNTDRTAWLLSSNLVFSPVHAKFQSGGSIVHFDLFVTGGAGVVDSDLSSGVAGNVGLGAFFFLGRAFGLRLELRDYIYRQQLLARKVLVNDLTATAGLSILLPFRE